MSFTVTILGSGSAIPTGRRNPTSQFVDCKNRRILIDCAEGTQMQMRKFGVKFQKVDIILISHMHGDHYFGLIGLLNTMHLLGRVKPLQIYSPPELKQIIDLQQHAGRGGFGFEIQFNDISPKNPGIIFEDEKITISCIPLLHKIPTCGFLIKEKPGELNLNIDKIKEDNIPVSYFHRLKNAQDVINDEGEKLHFVDYTLAPRKPRSYAFCSDTAYSEAIVPFIRQVDALYHEATFTDKLIERAKETKHSTASQAAEIAKLAEVKRLLIGHLSARFESGENHLLEAQKIFKNSTVVDDGMKITL